MHYEKINGSTYIIKGNTNVGVYVFKNKFVLLIDSGIGDSHAKKIDLILKENNLHPKYIVNTHSHEDHCGGNPYFKKNYPGTLVYTSEKEKLYMENKELRAFIICNSSPLKKFNKDKNPHVVDFILDYGLNKINDEKFQIISLKGHSHEQIGVITDDKVCFLGDSIFSQKILDKYSFPYLFNIEESIETLESLKTIDADYFVIAHADEVLNKDELLVLIDKNLENINTYATQIYELLDQPLTKEDLLQNIIILNDLNLSKFDYFLNLTSASAFLSYLYNNDKIDISLEDGKMYYYKI
ncbi:MBL fold metallo-hydrolase [Clostridium grantii]|uniref:Glyoxylase, beta-lactamase superfamily II n=1 Tax=Clostridium grantii DSM 8605 TaxID=1121316 RepID=A0A1M5QGM7_9CLOT|nr:MBL fold metallo-hydrolase [Clostridium grantii]SHH12653.1 Glyoxylase, beta-lactamase superfamily II [Clostridium grantii DSM 8605]